MSSTSIAAAENFINNETEFHLGFLPTEQANPATASMENDFKADTARGVMTIRKADRPVLEMAKKVFAGKEFKAMNDAAKEVLDNGGKIIFSGCGATGRLSILLESMFRKFAKENRDFYAPEQCESIMTGGDFALIRSVEFFEDFQTFGRRQVAEAGMTDKDMLVAITEGGETSSVIGTVKEAAERGAKVFLLFNNPASLLREHLIRCREVIDNPAVTVLDLSCGPMTLAGSTRMQATTSEELVAGALLENLAAYKCGGATFDWAAEFAILLDQLETPDAVTAMADHIDFESSIYQQDGKVTYFANDYLLDLFTDTTERNPTFMLPPFKSKAAKDAPQSWAFVKNPFFSTPETWHNMLNRPCRCLNWSKADYIAMDAGDKVAGNPPAISEKDLFLIEVGNEPAPERFTSQADRSVLVTVENAPGKNALLSKMPDADRILNIVCRNRKSPLELMTHLAVKLVLNTISTGTMVKVGRVTGNWMSYVSVSNKKLIDRAIRLICELGKTDYRTACLALFESIEILENFPPDREAPPPVQYTLQKLQK